MPTTSLETAAVDSVRTAMVELDDAALDAISAGVDRRACATQQAVAQAYLAASAVMRSVGDESTANAFHETAFGYSTPCTPRPW